MSEEGGSGGVLVASGGGGSPSRGLPIAPPPHPPPAPPHDSIHPPPLPPRQIGNMALLVANRASLASRYKQKAAVVADALRYVGAPPAFMGRVQVGGPVSWAGHAAARGATHRPGQRSPHRHPAACFAHAHGMAPVRSDLAEVAHPLPRRHGVQRVLKDLADGPRPRPLPSARGRARACLVAGILRLPGSLRPPRCVRTPPGCGLLLVARLPCLASWHACRSAPRQPEGTNWL